MSPVIRNLAVLLGALLSGFWWFGNWEIILKFVHAVNTGTKDPILGHDTGFYMFVFPFLQSAYGYLILIGILALIAVVVAHTRLTNDQQSIRFLPFENDSHL